MKWVNGEAGIGSHDYVVPYARGPDKVCMELVLKHRRIKKKIAADLVSKWRVAPKILDFKAY